MTTAVRWAAALLFAALLSPAATAFEKHVFQRGSRDPLPYRLFVPEGHDRGGKYPLILWLHGGGGRGRNNEDQLREGNSVGATVWTTRANQSRNPAFVVAPQCPEGEMWTTVGPNVRPSARLRQVVTLVKELLKTYSIDPRRVYIAGQSMGGYAVWALLAEWPDLFAAAVPICGGGDVSHAPRMSRVPIWAFHGELDRAVNVERSRVMTAAVRRAGGKVRYTEYQGADHVVWNRAFAEPELLPWVFAQRR